MLETDQLQRRLKSLGVQDEDLEENFILGTGSGGQKINKTSSCVQLIHRPSGIEIKCQQERSRNRNRHLARVQLCEQLEARRETRRAEKKAAREKARRRNRRRSPAQKARMLDDKKHRSRKKADRRHRGND